MRLFIKARKAGIGTVVYRRDGAYRKVAEGKWTPLPKGELQAHKNVGEKVKRAMRSVSSYDYNLSKPKGHAQMNQARYAALKKEFPKLSILYKRFMQINLKQSNKTGLDIEDDISDSIIKKLSGGAK